MNEHDVKNEQDLKNNQGVTIEQEAALNIERLLLFAEQHELLESLDVIPARNALLDLFGLAEPYAGLMVQTIDGKKDRSFGGQNDRNLDGRKVQSSYDSAVPILIHLLNYAAEKGLIEDNTATHRDLFDARIMGLLMPRASEVSRRFWSQAESETIEAATDWYYKMSIDSNYIRMDRIQNNKHWFASTPYGSLEITINLSKPEKDPKQIAAERRLPQSSYPMCLLCEENVGYAGRLNHPARQNHRIIPLTLTGDSWFLQYSPYVYYNEHSIAFKKEHAPMRITHDTFNRLIDFVEQFPHYFIGSNADLPIVGGSILNHDHFQAGRHAFPMELAAVDQSFHHKRYPNVKVGIVAWSMSVIRLSSVQKNELLGAAKEILDGWRVYSDSDVQIEAYSKEAEGQLPHNTITPIARRNKSGEWELDLVLRNNRTTAESPYGLFHPRESLHHIKKENIGLIEVMGLAILPGRLLSEVNGIVDVLSGEASFTAEMKSNDEHPLFKHADWIAELIHEHGKAMDNSKAHAMMEREIGHKFHQVLLDAGVYKRDDAGQSAFARFMGHMGYRRQ